MWSAKSLDDVQDAEILAVLVRVRLPAGRNHDAADPAERLQIGRGNLLEGFAASVPQVDLVDPHGKIALERVDVKGLAVRAPADWSLLSAYPGHGPWFPAVDWEEHHLVLLALVLLVCGDDELAVGGHLAGKPTKTLRGDGAPLPALEVLCVETERTPRFAAHDQKPLSIGEPACAQAFEVADRQGPGLARP